MKADRLMSIIMVLLDKKRVSAKELAAMFEVSLRTIYRDIDAIDLAGVPVIATSGVGGGFEILPNYKLDHKVFSSSDLSAILTSLSSMSHMIDDDSLTYALTKVRSLIPKQQVQKIELKVNQIRIDLNPWMVRKSMENHLEIIKVALDYHRLISFDYVDRHYQKTKRIVESYQLVLKNSRWYLQAFCLSRNDFRLFRLSRIETLKLDNTCFTPRMFEPVQLDFSDEIAAISQRINLRVHESALERILDFCEMSDVSRADEQHYHVSFPFVENDFYYNLLLELGNRCECLNPIEIRSALRTRIRAIADLYQE